MNFLKNNVYLDRLMTRAYVVVYILTLQVIVNIRFNSFMTDPRVIEPFYRLVFLPLFWASVILTLLSLIKKDKHFKLFSYLVFGLGTLFYLVEGFLLDTYSSLFTPSVAMAMLATNTEETKEFWSATINFSTYTQSFLGLGLASLFSLLTYLLTYLRSGVCNHLRSLFRLMLPAGMLPIIAVGLFYFYPKMFYIYATALDGGFAFATMTPPERFFWATEQVVENMNGAETYMEKVSKSNKLLNNIEASKILPPHRFVLILGESMRPDYMHCYGYNLKNTPMIDSLVQKGELHLFSDVVSPSHSTAGSITNFMSLKTLDDPKKWYEVPCLPIIMRSAGYKSFWLSKQEKLSAYLQPVYAIAKLSDSTHYITKGGKDDAVLPYIDNYIEEGEKNQNFFDVIHIMGSHVAYRNRYTKEFAKFKPEDITMEGLDDNQRFVVSAYANSIYFNDNVIGRIIKRYENEPTIIMYLSDHGQAIYDDPNNKNLAGHSLSLGGVSIPMMIYVSPSLASQAPKLVERIKQAKNKPFMTDILPFSILGLLDIETPFYKEKYDLFSQNYDINRTRIARWDERSLTVTHNSVDTLKMPLR